MQYESRRLKEKRVWDKVQLYAIFVAFFILLALISYIVFASDFFKISKIEVLGLSDGAKDEFLVAMKPLVIDGWPGNVFGDDNYFSWKSGGGYKILDYDQIEVEKDFSSRTIKVSVKRKQDYLAWCENDKHPLALSGFITKCFWVNENGQAFDQAPLPEGQLVFVVHDFSSSTQVVLGEPVLGETEWGNLKSVIEALKSEKIPISLIGIHPNLEELSVKTGQGANIRFSLRFDPRRSAIKALLQMDEKLGLENLATVDLSVENRAFYTEKE